MELDVSGQRSVEDDASLSAAHKFLATPADEGEEEEESLFLGADERPGAGPTTTTTTVLDYFAEYSAAKERHDSGISGSPVSISDLDPLELEQDNGSEGLETVTAITAGATAKKGKKDLKDVAKYVGGGSGRTQGAIKNDRPDKDRKTALAKTVGAEGRLRKRPSRSQRRDDQRNR